jgi:hypothetical protein
LAISRARSAVLFATLICLLNVCLLGAATAHARPSFELADTGARAGDAVPFSISEPGGWGVAYHLEIGGEDILDGSYAGAVSGTFTMPYLGDSARTVLVDAELWWSDNRRKDKRRLEYLGPALPAPDLPPSAPVSTVQAIAPQAAAPAPGSTPSAASSPSPAAAGPPKPRSEGRKRAKPHTSKTKHLGRGTAERRRVGHRVRNRKRGDAVRKHRRSKRSRHWKGGYYTGYAEPGQGRPTGRPGGFSALSAIVPPSAALVATAPRRGEGANPAVFVPALLGLAGVTLAGTAVLRRRRLASRSRRA